MSLQQITTILQNYPELGMIDFHGLNLFVRYASLARESIEFSQGNKLECPVALPPRILRVLASALGEKDTRLVEICWAAFRGLVWSQPCVAPTEDEILAFNDAALPHQTSFRHLYPPVRSCQNSDCQNYCTDENKLTLGEPLTYNGTLFTLKYGALPIHTTSFYCRRKSFSLHICTAPICEQFAIAVTTIIITFTSKDRCGHITVVFPMLYKLRNTFFVESSLLELFANNMVFGWLSGTNCARIYNEALSSPHSHVLNNKLAFTAIYHDTRHFTPDDWNVTRLIRKEDTMNGFFLYSLLLDKTEQSGILVLPHDEASQSDRLQPALAERNSAMEGTRQECYAHACDLCFHVFQNKDGQLMKLQAAACDGNTIGHRSCKVHDCKNPLSSPRHHFCPIHQHLRWKCAVVECSANISPGHQTCGNPDHRALETAYFRRGDAMFQLRSRLKKAGVSVPDDSVPIAESLNDHEVVFEIGPKGPVEVDTESESCEGKPENGNRRLRATFGGRWTHNEQLIMRTCGVILSRATLFGSEAVSAVNLFAKATFPTPESTPEFFIFDNNCKLDAHQRAIGDDHFNRTGKPVDVFHFKSKHKITDTHCQRYCNPAAFPEMIGQDGKWRFNTSICEQTNVWFGGYIAIVRDMEVTRYNFFLDEMIKRRNRYVVVELEAKGHSPWTIPLNAIFPDRIQG
ncbi:hypothetical protein MSAN_01994700 [Mycena sanguinolenta]|uniref:CxC6 like cysteine cluster associated with KDZ domain-containing protein n=1 Tax=Mycena sanguinolenta TaxID=230812 RepID=A0A8H7CNR9_9AGAR|nr:hypothetical protein MSAN_01994700 [Mycena sanguinolenta]